LPPSSWRMSCVRIKRTPRALQRSSSAQICPCRGAKIKDLQTAGSSRRFGVSVDVSKMRQSLKRLATWAESIVRSEFKFAVFDQQDRCSSTWKVVVHKNEAYLSANTLGGKYKTTFHSEVSAHTGGDCNTGLTETLRRSLVGQPDWEGKSRHFEVWKRPKGNRVQRLVELWMPTRFLGKIRSGSSKADRIPAGPEGYLVSIGIFRLPVGYNPSARSSNTICSLQFEDGAHLAVLKRELKEPSDLDDLISDRVRYALAPSDDERRYGSIDQINLSDPSSRALVWRTDRHGRRVCIDVSIPEALRKPVKHA
jgi:hypothetical protein